jgi:transposase
MGRGHLTDEQWAVLEPLLPKGKKAGRPVVWPRRQLLDGIRFRVRTGIPWRDVPAEYGPWGRVYDLFRRWQRNGTWQRVLRRLQSLADAKGAIAWDLNVDSRMTLVSALRYSSGSAFQLSPLLVAGLWPLWALGLWRTFGHGLAFVGFRVSGWVIGRVGAARSLLFGELFDNVANFVALVNPTVFSPVLLGSPAYGMSTIAQQTLLQREFTDQERATTGSLASLLDSVLNALVTLGAGLVADRWGTVPALLAIQTVVLIALPLAWWVRTHASSLPIAPRGRRDSDAMNAFVAPDRPAVDVAVLHGEIEATFGLRCSVPSLVAWAGRTPNASVPRATRTQGEARAGVVHQGRGCRRTDAGPPH